jgi:phenylalanyl-tRNA synthetase alpha chain
MREEIISVKNEALAQIMEASTLAEIENIKIAYLGRNGKLTNLIRNIKEVPVSERKEIGNAINEVKNTLFSAISERKNSFEDKARVWFDPTLPGQKIEGGHLHLVTQAIEEIAETFENIGFVRVRYPEVEWDHYAFEALNMPVGHAARDEWETFFIDEKANLRFGQIVLTPHTSSGQIREMERVKVPPIRMINIAKCYRRQIDISHVPMFHQFEGLVIDKDITIPHLKATLNYFVKSFFGTKRSVRLRPYHFQFTEPSFEIDVSCGVCEGKGCKVCKGGWLELGGAGMVHPNVLKNCKIDPNIYSGFAFGWGVERVFFMKNNLNLPDLRLLYSDDIRFLKQF